MKLEGGFFISLLICLFQTKGLRFISHRFLFPEKQPPLLVDYPSSLKEIAFPGKEERKGEGEEGELISFLPAILCLFPTQNHLNGVQNVKSPLKWLNVALED